MKNLIFILLLLHQLSAQAQVGQTAMNIADDILIATIPITAVMTSIEDSQKQVAKSSKAVAIKSAAIAVLKEDELASLTDEPEGLRETTHWKQSIAAGIGIINTNINSVEILNEFPELQGFIGLNALVSIGTKAINLSEDLEAVSQAGPDNRMTPTGRYKLIKKINYRLLKIYKFSKIINEALRALVIISIEHEPITVDFTEVINNSLLNLDNLLLD